MSKTVVINLGYGDLNKGFPKVIAQLYVAGHPKREQFIGSLPAAPALIELYRNWQSIYQAGVPSLPTVLDEDAALNAI